MTKNLERRIIIKHIKALHDDRAWCGAELIDSHFPSIDTAVIALYFKDEGNPCDVCLKTILTIIPEHYYDKRESADGSGS